MVCQTQILLSFLRRGRSHTNLFPIKMVQRQWHMHSPAHNCSVTCHCGPPEQLSQSQSQSLMWTHFSTDVVQPGATAGKQGSLWRQRLGCWNLERCYTMKTQTGRNQILVVFNQKALNPKEHQQLVLYQIDACKKQAFSKQGNYYFF